MPRGRLPSDRRPSMQPKYCDLVYMTCSASLLSLYLVMQADTSASQPCRDTCGIQPHPLGEAVLHSRCALAMCQCQPRECSSRK